MFQEAFTKLDQKKTSKVLRDMGGSLHGISTDPEAVTILTNDVSFYPGYKIADITDHSQIPPARRIALYKQDDCVVLDWTNTPLYDLNRRAPLVLNEVTVVEYVRFFFAHVRGKSGRFLIVENVDEISWRESPPPAARKAVSKLLDPLRITGVGADGSYTLSLCVVLRTSLFRATVTVSAQGQIDLRHDDVLIEDLPVMDDVLGV